MNEKKLKTQGKQACRTIFSIGAMIFISLFMMNFVNAGGVGGTITTDGLYTVHTYTSNATFNWTGASSNIEVLVVAGAGGGAKGGGGAGGVNYTAAYLLSAGFYNVTVGAGGVGGTAGGEGSNGQNSSIDSYLVAMGGGRGTAPDANGAFGGSGSGAGLSGSPPKTGGKGYLTQGKQGGWTLHGASQYPAGGGGGCGVAGGNTTSTSSAGDGGDGCTYTIYNGTALYYSGGGGGALAVAGGSNHAGTGGKGGGGSGLVGAGTATAGTPNTGGAGGGSDGTGGAGGSGIVIIRYLTSSGESTSINVSLVSPANNSLQLNSEIAFVSSLNITGTNYSQQWKNITYVIWLSNGTLFNSTLKTGLTGNSTSVSQNITGFNLGSYLWDVYACYGNTTLSNCSWSNNGNYSFTAGMQISSVSYNASSFPTSTETFLLQGVKNIMTSSINATFYYNGTSYPSTVVMSGNNVNITNTISIPQLTMGNYSFYWVITSFGTIGSITQNSSTYYQNVNNLSIYACTGVNPFGLTLNFTLYDESTKLKLNGSLETTFTYFSYGGSGTYTQSYNFASINESKSNWMFCINSSGSNVSFSGYASYYADYYDRREYIFNNATIGNFTQNIPLYLSLIADTEVINIIVTDENYNPINNALVNIQEWNVGTNTYSTIGMLYTDSNGNGFINLELYNLWYRATVTIDGQIVEVTDVKKLSSTTWSIIVELVDDNPYNLFGTISHGLVFDNNTNITTFSWSDSSGYINYGCLDIRNKTALGYRTFHTECISSLSGTINYQIVGNGDFEIVGTIYLLPTYNVSKVTDVKYIRLGTPTLTSKVSRYGKVLSFVFIGVAIGIGVSAGSPILGVFLLMISIFVSGKLGWLNITESIFWGLLSIAIVVLLRQTRRGQ